MSRVGSAGRLLFGAWRVRPLGRRILWTLSLVLALSGVGMLSYPAATDLISDREQSRLLAEFRAPEFRTRSSSVAVAPGHVAMRILIPAIGVDSLVVEGTDPRALRAGAGRYRSTAQPCAQGNVGIAGHRNVYGSPFLRLDELRVGDEISLITPTRTCTYRVVDGPTGKPRPRSRAAGWITGPDDGAVIGPTREPMLTLTTCHPKTKATKRLIIRARRI